MNFIYKCISCFLVSYLLLMRGCTTSLPNEYEVYSWPKAVMEIDSLVEKDENIFFISKDGLSKYDKIKEIYTVIIKSSTINSFQLSNDSIYYCEKENTIYKMDFNGENIVKIVELNQVSPLLIEKSLENFAIWGDNIYIKSSGISFIRYSMVEKQAENFIDDIAQYTFFENSLYFIDHINKSFSLYRKNLDTLSVELLRGDGISKRNNYSENVDIYARYDNIIAANKHLFYTTRNPAKLFQFSESGEDILIEEFKSVEGAEYLTITANENKIYYVLESGELKDYLFEYDIETGEKEQKIMLQNANYAFGIKVIDGYVFYRSNNNCIHFLCL